MLAIVAPGQGSQTPGFLSPWLENSRSSTFIQNWSSLIELDLRYLGSTADAVEIRETSNAQPLLVAAGLITASTLFNDDFSKVALFAGHSVGEITVAALSRCIDFESAMKLVRTRGIEMSKAATGTNTGMAAVLGGDRDAVLTGLAELNLTAANENGAGQIVAAGNLAQIELLLQNPPAGSRVRPLAVSGAFHTAVMQPAVPVLRALSGELEISNPPHGVLSNKDGAYLSNGQEIIDRIVGQIASPVRWDLCMDTMAAMGVTGVIELAPAGTLVGLIKRAHPSVESFALKSPEELDGAREFVAKHGSN